MNNPDHPRAGHVLRNLGNKYPGRTEIIRHRVIALSLGLAIVALMFAGAYALDASR